MAPERSVQPAPLVQPAPPVLLARHKCWGRRSYSSVKLIPTGARPSDSWATADCQPGQIVTGGGYDVPSGVEVITEQTYYGNGWLVYFDNTTNVDKYVTVNVVCAFLTS